MIHPCEAAAVEALSRRLGEDLTLLAWSKSNEDSAEAVEVALNAVKVHVGMIYKAVGVPGPSRPTRHPVALRNYDVNPVVFGGAG